MYRKYIRTKTTAKKEELFELFKTYRNPLNKITELSKANYCSKYFEENKKKLYKVWYGKKLKKLLILIKEVPKNHKTLAIIENL